MTRHRALKSKRVNFGDLDEPEFTYLPGWPAICALGRVHPELAYKQFRDKGHGFVYDNRKGMDSTVVIARIDKHNDWDYSVVVGGERLCHKQTVSLCLQFIKYKVLRIV